MNSREQLRGNARAEGRVRIVVHQFDCAGFVHRSVPLFGRSFWPAGEVASGRCRSMSKLSDALNGPLADTVTGCVMPTEIVPHTDCTVSDVRAADGIGIDHDPIESYALSCKSLATDGQKSVNCVSHCRRPPC